MCVYNTKLNDQIKVVLTVRLINDPTEMETMKKRVNLE